MDSPEPMGALFSVSLDFSPKVPTPIPSILNPQPSTLHPQPSTLNPQPSTMNLQLQTINHTPKPHTLTQVPNASTAVIFKFEPQMPIAAVDSKIPQPLNPQPQPLDPT